MKIAKWIILISLLSLLLAGAVLLDPLVRFTLALQGERFADADAIYGRIRSSDRLEAESEMQLRSYVTRHLQRYYAKEAPYDRVRGILSALADTGLPQQDIESCTRDIDDMEDARTILAQADGFYSSGEYARAIPLFRRSLIADETAALRLKESEIRYKNDVLEGAETAMDAGEFDAAESLLLNGIDVLDNRDDDLLVALEDVRRLKAGEIYNVRVQEARRLLAVKGPEAAFGYVAELLEESPDEYELVYLDQVLRHEYEADICARAQAMREAGDPVGACSMLAEGLLWIDSQPVRTQLAQTRADISFWLTDLPLLRDETADMRTGAESTVARNLSMTDSLSNEYSHSFWADTGSVSFAVADDFSVFMGTVAFPMGEKSDIYRASATLKIYADGELLAEFKNVEIASAPISFSLPVTGVRELTLTWTSEGAGGWKDWGRFAAIYDGRFLVKAPEQ